MSPRAIRLLVAILVVMSLGVGVLVVIEPPEQVVPDKPPPMYTPPALSKVRDLVGASDIEQPSYTYIDENEPENPGTGPSTGSTGNQSEPNVEESMIFDTWKWKRICEDAKTSGRLYAVVMDERSGLTRKSSSLGIRLVVGNSQGATILEHVPAMQRTSSESLGRAPMNDPLPDAVINPFQLLEAIKGKHPGAIVVELNIKAYDVIEIATEEGMSQVVLDAPRPLVKAYLDLNGEGDFSFLYFDATSGRDVSAELTGEDN